jgi:pyruvate kinase
MKLMVTLCPTMPHYHRFAFDPRLSGIRLNSAMVFGSEVDREIQEANHIASMGMYHLPEMRALYFDIKGRQLRVTENHPNKEYLDITINHPIEVKTPTVVLFKAGSDPALLKEIRNGNRLIFEGGPRWKVKEGESLCIRDPSLKVRGPIFCDYEIEKIDKVVKGGFRRFFLSYVEDNRDYDEFREIIGFEPEETILKIESKGGLKFVANKFKKKENISLCAARGDMYVEIDKPHEILEACKLVVEKDPYALVGSRILLSIVNSPVPECHDFSDLAWLYDIGYSRMMLCDEICLKEDLLGTAIQAFDAFRSNYCGKSKPKGSRSWNPFSRWFGK